MLAGPAKCACHLLTDCLRLKSGEVGLATVRRLLKPLWLRVLWVCKALLSQPVLTAPHQQCGLRDKLWRLSEPLGPHL